MPTAERMERDIVGKFSRRIVPVLFLGIFVGYLDRVNVAFAALTMNDSSGLSPTAYGWGASFFFIGYLAFKIPRTLCLTRFGSRLCMAIFMGMWGVLSVLRSQVSGPMSLMTLRFLTGLAEAEFLPGTIFYISLWVPATHRARIGGYFMLAIPLASVIGGPVSVTILHHLQDVVGLQGWQWLFIIEDYRLSRWHWLCL